MGLVEQLLGEDRVGPALSTADADGSSVDYPRLRERVSELADLFAARGVSSGSAVALDPGRGASVNEEVAALLAAFRVGAIAVPLGRGEVAAREGEALERAAVEWKVSLDGLQVERTASRAGRSPRAFEALRQRGASGLVLFTSGSEGRAKGVVHDVERLGAKFLAPGKDLRTLLFFHLDHISGLDTLFYALSNGSEVVVPADRSPASVCAAIEARAVEVLPTSPTFLHLLLLSGAVERFDLGSLRVITYGGEVMPEATLRRVSERFPGVRLSQKYGSTEFGTLITRPEGATSLWWKLSDAGSESRVKSGRLQLRTGTTMVGYLDDDAPLTEDGWFDTGDLAEERNGAIRVLGRESQLINVGGEKVHPAHVESVLLELDELAEVAVYGEPNELLGSIVCARVLPVGSLTRSEAKRLIRRHARGRLADHETPMRIEITERSTITERHKRDRRSDRAG